MRPHCRNEEKSGITRSELARRLDVTRSSVNSWKMGFATPQLKHTVKMSRIFNTTADEPLNTSSKVVIDITDPTEKEREAVFNIVECLKAKKEIE